MTAPNHAAQDDTAPCPICTATALYDFSGRDLMFRHHKRYDYYLCSECGANFIHPMPDHEKIAAFYPPEYEVFDARKSVARVNRRKRAFLKYRHGYAHLKASRMDYLWALFTGQAGKLTPLDYVPGGALLDVGCGNGRYLNTMRALGWSCYGVETNDKAARQCREAGLYVHHGLLDSAGFPSGRFDVVTARHVIEHVPNPHEFLGEVFRILKPGGLFLVETPNADALGRQWLRQVWYANDVPRHLILYNPQTLLRLAKTHGLSKDRLIQETSPKVLLNSVDYVTSSRTLHSKYSKLRRLLARLYCRLAQQRGRGDNLIAFFRKPARHA
jgi:2-polyprenyl-3-methyl-5-hydroxy-6-metoxy-1,4-benzoquinol methylase